MTDQTTRKSPEAMTIAELQAEISRLQMVLHYKVCGDPRHYVSVGHGGAKTGCMCPPGAEAGCKGGFCPRRGFGDMRAT